MPVVTVYQHGVTAGVAPSRSDHERAKRGACQGWTPRATRANLQFLRSIEVEKLTGLGHTFTLTVRRCPPSPAAWAAMRKNFIDRLRRFGLVRLHWVTEWQCRGVPHLHGIAYFSFPHCNREYARQHRLLNQAWLEVVNASEADSLSQHVTPVTDEVGWAKYLAKHAARGVNHYQRSQETIPARWQGATGRVWGKVGSWPVRDGMKLQMASPAYWEFRRVVRAWRKADARASGDVRRIVSARKMLKCSKRSVSETRGVSEWIPQEVQLTMVSWVNSLGYQVVC